MSTKIQKNAHINLRIDHESKSKIYGAAEEAGIAPAAFVRDAALQRAGGFTSEDQRNLRRLLGQIGRVGNNVNQLTKNCHQSGAINPETIEKFATEFAALRAEVRSALS